MFTPSIIIPSSIVFILSIVFFLQQAKENVKSLGTIVKIVVCVLVLSIFSFLQLLSPIFTEFSGYIILLIIYFGLGILYTNLFSKGAFGQFNENEKLDKFIVLIHCIAILALSFILFVSVYNYFGGEDSYGLLIAPSIFVFIIPSLFLVCFKFLIDIPSPIYSVWYCPAEPDEIDYEILENSKILILNIEFTLTPNSEKAEVMKVRAPVRLAFKLWFAKFIFDYNEKYFDKPLVINNELNQPYGWMFYTKPSFFKKKKYIDPDSIIKDNFFPDNVVIVAKRVSVYEQ